MVLARIANSIQKLKVMVRVVLRMNVKKTNLFYQMVHAKTAKSIRVQAMIENHVLILYVQFNKKLCLMEVVNHVSLIQKEH